MFFVRCFCFFWLTDPPFGTDGVDNFGTWGLGGIIDLVWFLLLLVYSGTLELDGAPIVFVGVVALDILCCNARFVIWISWCIYLPPLLLPKLFIDLAQSAIGTMTLSASVMVGWVSSCGWNVLCLWNICCWWILCGIYVLGSVLVMSQSTIHQQCGLPMCLFCLYFHVLVLICPLVLVAFCYSQMGCSDGRMPKRLEFHWTDATGWLLFWLVVGVCPTMMAENLVLYLPVYWESVPWNFVWPLMMHLCGVCLVVLALAAFCIHLVLLSSGIMALHCPVYIVL